MNSNLFNKLVSGDKAALAKAITLAESTSPEHFHIAENLIKEAFKTNKNTIRIAITGIPGVGKSTFINKLGTWLVNEKAKKVCVLAIDPSSTKNKGSILGDKTRMNELAVLKNAFIRPTPSGGIAGGISQKTPETTLLCEAAGYDVILIETVGIGQSETDADNIADCMLLLQMADTGDELQGIKRGIMETTDIIVLNKADILNKTLIKSAENEYKNALHYIEKKHEGWVPPVLTNSLNDNNSVIEIWNNIEKFVAHQKKTGNFEKKRHENQKIWFAELLKNKLNNDFFNNISIKNEIDKNSSRRFDNDFNIDNFLKKLLKNWLDSSK